MKRNMIWLIPLAIFLVFSVAAGAVFAVMYTKSMTDLRASARRSADAMFGDWTEIVRKIKTLESDREKEFCVEAGLDIPGEMVGLGESLKVTAAAVRDPGGSESVRVSLAGKGDPACAGIMLSKDKHLTVAATLPDGNRQSVGFDVPGCADAFRGSRFNPETNPDSMLDEENFDAVLELFEWLETALTGKEIEVPEEDRKTAEEVAKVIRDLVRDLSKLPETEKENTGNIFAPAASVTVRLSNEKLSEAIDLIKEALSNRSVRKLILSYASMLSAQGGDGDAGDGSQSDTEEALSARIDEVFEKIGDFVRESKISVTLEADIKGGKITSAMIRVPFEYEFETPDGDGEREHEAVLSLNADYGDGKKKLTVEFDAESGGVPEAGLTAEYLAEDREGEDGAGKVWTLTLEMTEEPEEGDESGYYEKVGLKLEYDSESAEYRLTADGDEVIAGTFRSDDSSLEFTVGRANLTARSELFVYGKGLSKTEKPVAAVDLFRLRVSSGEGEEGKTERDGLFAAEGEMSLFELTESDLEKFTGEEGFVASFGRFMTESFPPDKDDKAFYTTDGYAVDSKTKTEKRAKEILGAYTAYLNNLGRAAITAESSYVYLNDKESALWFILVFDGESAKIYPAASVDGMDLTGFHKASMNGSSMTIHHWRNTTPRIECEEEIYSLETCSDCGLVIKTTTGRYREHVYDGGYSSAGEAQSLQTPGTPAYISRNTCLNCGREWLRFDGQEYVYRKKDGEYLLESIGFVPGYDSETRKTVMRVLDIGAFLKYEDLPVRMADGCLFEGLETTGVGAAYLGPNVKNVGARAFAGVSDLRVVMMYPGVESIGEGAFSSTSLEVILFCGTEAEWKAIDIADREVLLKNVKVVFGCAGDPSLMREYTASFEERMKVAKNFESALNKTKETRKNSNLGTTGVSLKVLDDGMWFVTGCGVYTCPGYDRFVVDSGNRCAVIDIGTGASVGELKGSCRAVGNGVAATLFRENDKSQILVYDLSTLQVTERIDGSSGLFDPGARDMEMAFCGEYLYVAVRYSSPFRLNLKDGSTERIPALETLADSIDHTDVMSVAADVPAGLVYIRAGDRVYVIDALTAKQVSEFLADIQTWSMLPEDGGVTMMSKRHMEGYAGGVNTDAEVVTHRHFVKDGEVLTPASKVSAPSGYTVFDIVMEYGGCTVFTARDAGGGFRTFFRTADGRTKSVPAIAEYVAASGDGVFVMWSGYSYNYIIVDTNK